MAKIDSSLQLTQIEIDNLMSTLSRCRIATIGPGTDINLTPMTFGWASGKVYIFGRGQKITNLRRNNSATVLVDIGDSWTELKGIMMRGAAKILETQVDEKQDEGLEQAMHNLGQKHDLTKGGKRIPYTATASGRSRRWIVFQPNNIVSWNNEKLSSRNNA